jgi:hypothetical protein
MESGGDSVIGSLMLIGLAGGLLLVVGGLARLRRHLT